MAFFPQHCQDKSKPLADGRPALIGWGGVVRVVAEMGAWLAFSAGAAVSNEVGQGQVPLGPCRCQFWALPPNPEIRPSHHRNSAHFCYQPPWVNRGPLPNLKSSGGEAARDSQHAAVLIAERPHVTSLVSFQTRAMKHVKQKLRLLKNYKSVRWLVLTDKSTWFGVGGGGWGGHPPDSTLAGGGSSATCLLSALGSKGPGCEYGCFCLAISGGGASRSLSSPGKIRRVSDPTTEHSQTRPQQHDLRSQVLI